MSTGRRQLAFVLAAAAFCSAVVLYYAWISEDAFITLTYVRNLLDGNGAVYNLGERVQGYTHPLWFLLLIPGLALVGEPLFVVTALGVGLTFLTFLVLGRALFEHQRRPAVAASLLLLLAVVLVWTESWRSFQTAGLENSLTNFLIALLVVELFRSGGYRVLPATLICSLLFLTRPDLAVLVAPLSLHVLSTAARRRKLPELVLGTLPALAWLAFAQLYYDGFLPNTANAKLGVNSLAGSLHDGLVYFIDWLYYEPVTVLAGLTLWTIAARSLRRWEQRAFLLGILLYFGYVLLVGGDYMRGRFWLPVLVGGAYCGVFALSQLANEQRLAPKPAWLAAAMALLLLLNLAEPTQSDRFSVTGIVAERHFYGGLSLRYYARTGELSYRQPDVKLIDDLSAFRAACGPFTIHSGVIGALGYLRDPDIRIIDTIGLTDAYIASLDRSYLVDMDQRPGHPRRYIPLGYLAGRGDISIFEDWKEAVAARDCTIIERTGSFAASEQRYNPREPASGPSFFSPTVAGPLE